MLQGDVLCERVHVFGARQHEQVAALAQADGVARLGLELLEHADALDRQPDIDLDANWWRTPPAHLPVAP